MDSNIERDLMLQLEKIRKSLASYINKVAATKSASQNLRANIEIFWQSELQLLSHASHLIDWDIWINTLFHDYQFVPDARNEINDLLGNIKALIDQSKEKNCTASGINISLPCSPGNTIYIIESEYKGRKKTGEKIVPAIIDHFTIGHSCIPLIDACTKDNHWYIALKPGDYYLSFADAQSASCEIHSGLDVAKDPKEDNNGGKTDLSALRSYTAQP